MHYPPPRKEHHWRTKLKARPEPPYKTVRKKIHGKMMNVKVYEPLYAQPTIDCDGLSPALAEANRFSRDRGRALERKAYEQKRDSGGRFGKK